MNIKGQAALEFMATYGWAILVIMIAIGALAYFGFTNPAQALPDKCIFGNGLICQDSRITATAVNLSIVNGIGKSIYNVSVVPEGVAGTCRVTPNLTVSGDNTMRVDCDIATKAPVGQKIKYKFTANYRKVFGGFNQVSLGEVYGTVQ